MREGNELKCIRPSFLYACQIFKNIVAVEVGVGTGENAYQMMFYKPNLKLYLVDIVNNTNGLDVIVKPSVEAAKDFQDEFFDYVYIDAEHTQKAVLEDLEAWYPKVKYGGVLAGHDSWKQGVRAAVVEFFGRQRTVVFCMMAYLTEEFRKVWGNTIPSREAEFMDWWVIK